MKTKIGTLSLVAIAITGLLASCSSSNQFASNFHKRKYTKGIFLDQRGKYTLPDANKATAHASEAKPATTGTIATNGKSEKTVTNQAVTTQSAGSSTAITVNATSLKVKHTVTITSYSPSISSSKTNNTITAASNLNSQNSITSAGGYHSNGGGGGPCKSWIAALLLCFFLGGLGIHRFYLGYTWQGIVQLLTLGGCGIWALIDFVRIIIKSLPPKNGSYCD